LAVGCLPFAVAVAAVTPAAVPAGSPAPGGDPASANAKVIVASALLTRLETRAEVLTERYDHAVSLEQQATADYRAALSRLAWARQTQRINSGRLAEMAAADYESTGGQGQMALLLGNAGGPDEYLGAMGAAEVLANRRVELLAASRADRIVSALFSEQAREHLAQRRANLATVSTLRTAVESAVRQQVAAVGAAKLGRNRLAAELAGSRASTGSRNAKRPTGLSSGAGPSWSADAGAPAAWGNSAAKWALTQLGKPYRWGGAGPRFYDCSGLTMDAWAKAGLRIGHWTGFQWESGPHVPVNRLRRGDLVFYATDTADPGTIHHVGIYVGHGQIVDAPYTGAFVRVDSIYRWPGLIGATRPAR
jgi:cell wall-associated NlpC family hydrolase